MRRAIAAVLRSLADELDPKPKAPTHPYTREVEAMLAERAQEVGESLASARLRRDIDRAQAKIYPITAITRKRMLRGGE